MANASTHRFCTAYAGTGSGGQLTIDAAGGCGGGGGVLCAPVTKSPECSHAGSTRRRVCPTAPCARGLKTTPSDGASSRS